MKISKDFSVGHLLILQYIWTKLKKTSPPIQTLNHEEKNASTHVKKPKTHEKLASTHEIVATTHKKVASTHEKVHQSNTKNALSHNNFSSTH